MASPSALLYQAFSLQRPLEGHEPHERREPRSLTDRRPRCSVAQNSLLLYSCFSLVLVVDIYTRIEYDNLSQVNVSCDDHILEKTHKLDMQRLPVRRHTHTLLTNITWYNMSRTPTLQQ